MALVKGKAAADSVRMIENIRLDIVMGTGENQGDGCSTEHCSGGDYQVFNLIPKHGASTPLHGAIRIAAIPCTAMMTMKSDRLTIGVL